MSNKALLNELLEITTEATVKGRGASGKATYLDRFVSALLNEDGQPTAPKTRTEIITEIAYEITIEKNPEFDVKDPEQKAEFIKLVNKVKHQVAAAVSDSNNSTALSYNASYKDVWQVVKDGKTVALTAKVAEAPVKKSDESAEKQAKS